VSGKSVKPRRRTEYCVVGPGVLVGTASFTSPCNVLLHAISATAWQGVNPHLYYFRTRVSRSCVHVPTHTKDTARSFVKTLLFTLSGHSLHYKVSNESRLVGRAGPHANNKPRKASFRRVDPPSHHHRYCYPLTTPIPLKPTAETRLQTRENSQGGTREPGQRTDPAPLFSFLSHGQGD
jgi:hypothetical protein